MICKVCRKYPACNKKNGGDGICARCLREVPSRIKEKFKNHYSNGRNRRRFIPEIIEILRAKKKIVEV